MLSEARQERSALRWVRSDLESVLQEARHGLEDYVNGQPERLQVCVERLHHVHRSLDLMQVCGAAMLAEEMERLAASLAAAQVQRVDAAAEALMLAFVQLPSYLSKVEQGGADVPFALLPVMNDLRAAQDISLVSETALFAPRLNAVIAAETVRPGSGNRSLPALLNSHRSHYHRALLNWIRGQDVQGGLQQLQQLFGELRAGAGTPRLQRLLQAAEALVVTVLEAPESPAIAVKPLFGKLDRVFKRIIDQGEEAAMLEYPVDLLKNFLFYVSRSESDDPAVTAVKQSAVLLGAPMADAGDRLEADDLSRPDQGMFDAVADALGHDLRDVKDQLDLFMRGDRSQASRLTELAEPVRRIGDTLGMVGQGDLRGRLRKHSDALAAVQSADVADDEQLMALASDLLLVESALSDLGAGQSAAIDPGAEDGADVGLISDVELQQHAQTAINEALVELAHVKDGIVEYLGGPDRGELLNDVIDRLRVVAGVADMLAVPHAGSLLNALEPYVADLARGERSAPNAAEQDALADVVVSSELLMRSVIDAGESQDKLRRVGVDGLEALGLDAGQQAVTDETEGTVGADEPAVDNVVPLHPVTNVSEQAGLQTETALEASEPVEADAVAPEPELDAADDADVMMLTEEPPDEAPEAAAETESASGEPIELAVQGEVDAEILEVFAEEAVEELGVIQDCLPKWQSNPGDAESLATMRRSFHTLKGSGRIVGALNLGEFAWSVENLLNRVIDTTVSASPELMGLMTDVVEALPKLVDESSRLGQPATDVSPLTERAFALASGETLAAQPTAAEGGVAEAATVEDVQAVADAEASLDAPAATVDAESILNEGFAAVADDDDILEPGLILGSADSSLFAVFASEAASHVHVLGDFVARADAAGGGMRFEEGVRRAMHTLRGSARTAGVPAMAELAGSLERLSDIFSHTSRFLAPACVDLFTRAHAVLGEMVEELEDPQTRAPDPAPLCREIDGFVDDLAHPAPDLEAVAAVESGKVSPGVGQDAAVDSTDAADPELLEIFVNEARELLRALEQDLATWLRGDDPQAPAKRLRHTLHNMKVGARLSGLEALGSLSHAMESLFGALLEQRVEIDADLRDLVREAVGVLSEDVDGLEAGQAPAAHEQITGRIEAASRTETGTPGSVAEAAAPPVDAPDVPDPEMLGIFLDEAPALREALEHDLPTWLRGDDPQASVQGLQDTLHTVKVGARLSGLAALGSLSHAMQSFFEALGEQRVEVDKDLKGLVREAVDVLSQDINGLEAGRVPVAHAEIIERIEVASRADSVEAPLDVATNAAVDSADAPDPEMLEIFLEEARELLDNLEQDLPSWLRGDDAQASVQRLQRTLHTMKGGARLSGLAALGNLSHAMESLFEALVEQRVAGDDTLQELVREAVDVLSQDIDGLATGQVPEQHAQLMGRLEAAARGRPVEGAKAPAAPATEAALLVPSIFQDPAGPIASAVPETSEDSVASAAEESAQREPPDPEMLDIFLEEANELLEGLERELPDWLSGDDPLASVRRLQRTLHTMKGGARLSGLAELGDLSHAMESVFEAAGEQRLDSDERLQTLVRRAADALSQDVEQLGQGRLPDAHVDIVSRLEAAAHGRPWQDLDVPAAPAEPEMPVEVEVRDDSPVGEAHAGADDLETVTVAAEDSQLLSQSELLGESSFVIPDVMPMPDSSAVGSVLSPDSDLVAQSAASEDAMAQDGFLPRKPLPRTKAERAAKVERVRVPSDALDYMVNHAGEVSIFRARLEQQNNSVAFNIGELEQTTDRLRKQLRDLEMETETQVLSRHERESDSHAHAEFDPLEMDRYSRIQQLSRALSETVEDLANLGETLTDLSRYTDTLLLQQSRVVNDLQDSLLHTRMVKFGSRAPRLERVVRQTAQGVGKQAELHIVGGGTDVDRAIIERMMGPLEHLLRNAVSHGIEDNEMRERQGKPRQGSVTLSLAREGSDIVLELADDGRGLDTNAIRSKAEQRGLLEPGAAIENDKLFELILQPGFSTAAELSQVSGRGVGMDVVLTEVKQLGGNLDISSKPGKGTRFTIRLPFTLAITDSLLVTAGDDIYAVPHSSSDGVVRIPVDKLKDIYAGKKSSFRYGGHDYRVRYLGSMLSANAPILHDAVRWLPLILVRAGEHRVAIQVDNVLGNRQIVVKSVGVQLSTVPWFTGGTILADGQIALILDVNSLVRNDQAQPVAATSPAPDADIEARGVSVMVVDDSITVRKVTSRLLERHNMAVLTAKDGVDAITQLQDRRPDVMLLDIEMPRMDGYELARHMRSTPELSAIPIVMITSRTGDKHRNRAMELGVKRYLGKPYQEADLLENIYAVLAEVKDAGA